MFNGEIYNYVELRDELRQHGFAFHTDCDTEVLLAAYEHWGSGCFARLNGAWAIVVWDNERKELVASRDRIGEKPLVYTEVDGDWIFASEVKALLCHPRVSAQPNEQSIVRFIANGANPVTGQTFFAGIRSVEPGTFITVNNSTISTTRYWDLDALQVAPRHDEAAVIDELRWLLTDAVKVRLRGDLRVGAMLSGGVDSTSVISSIAELLSDRIDEGRSIGDHLQAFTASFPGLENDETDKVEDLCRRIDIATHKVFPLEQERLEQRLLDVSRTVEAPFWSPVVIVHDSLMKLIASTDVQIVLDGQAADELFGGYDWYLPLAVKDACRGLRFGDAWRNLSGMRTRHGRNLLKEIVRALLPDAFPGYVDVATRLLRGQAPRWDNNLFRHEVETRDLGRREAGGAGKLERELRDALLRDNTPRWLHMGDNVSMANRIICRSPFLDYRLMEFAFGLANDLKIRNGVTKYVLREAKRDRLPSSILDDSRKIQFSGPGPEWLNGPLKPFALSIRDEKTARLANFLEPGPLAAFIDDYYETKPANSPPMWRIVNCESWLRAFF